MKRQDFARPYPGRIVDALARRDDGRTVKTVAYIPHRLPPKISFGMEVTAASERALLALGELRAVVPALPEPTLISEPFLRREAVLSSKIEGTRTELEGLYLFEAAKSDDTEPPGESDEDIADAQEVLNYVEALRYGLNFIKSTPICIRLLKEMHEILLHEVKDHRGRYHSPGVFRNSLAFIGKSDDILAARYVTPPADELNRLMADLEEYINSDCRFLTLANIAMIHYQFEAIHPFSDGNGRLGRLLITLLLCAFRILPEPLLYLSAYFERNREDYNQGMFRVSASGDWENWVLFFLTGVESESLDACERARKILALREQYRSKLQSEARSSSLLKLVDGLFQWPATTVKRAEKLLEQSFQGASRNIDKLEEMGILSEATGRQRNRIFMAREIIKLLN